MEDIQEALGGLFLMARVVTIVYIITPLVPDSAWCFHKSKMSRAN